VGRLRKLISLSEEYIVNWGGGKRGGGQSGETTTVKEGERERERERKEKEKKREI